MHVDTHMRPAPGSITEPASKGEAMHFNTITIDTDGKAAFTALVADAPKEAGPKPALILLHEIFGLNGAMRDTARLFADPNCSGRSSRASTWAMAKPMSPRR